MDNNRKPGSKNTWRIAGLVPEENVKK